MMKKKLELSVQKVLLQYIVVSSSLFFSKKQNNTQHQAATRITRCLRIVARRVPRSYPWRHHAQPITFPLPSCRTTTVTTCWCAISPTTIAPPTPPSSARSPSARGSTRPSLPSPRSITTMSSLSQLLIRHRVDARQSGSSLLCPTLVP